MRSRPAVNTVHGIYWIVCLNNKEKHTEISQTNPETIKKAYKQTSKHLKKEAYKQKTSKHTS